MTDNTIPRPVIVTIRIGGGSFRMAIHQICHPGFLHSIFWLSNELVMRTWGNFRDVLNAYPYVTTDTSQVTDPKTPATVIIHDGDRSAHIDLPVTTLEDYANGFFKMLSTITSVTGGIWHLIVQDMLRVLDRVDTWVLPEVNQMSLITSPNPRVNARVQSAFLTDGERNGHWWVGTANHEFYVPTLYAIAPTVAHYELKGIGEQLSASEIFKLYIAHMQHYVDSSGPDCPTVLHLHGPGGTECIALYQGRLIYGSDEQPVPVPHPVHGHDLVSILRDRLATHDN